MAQNYWNSSDQVGRIRVELSNGFVDPTHNRFVKVLDVVTFAFQPAPMGKSTLHPLAASMFVARLTNVDVLEHSGIAWPNPLLLANPMPVSNYLPSPGMFSASALPANHKRTASRKIEVRPVVKSTHAAGLLPDPFTHDSSSNNINSSRSTSTYATVDEAAGPLLHKIPAIPALHGEIPTDPQSSSQPQWRLPSDQLQEILRAIQPAKENADQVNSNNSAPANMLPPPLPTQTTDAKAKSFPLLKTDVMHPNVDVHLGPGVVDFMSRRDLSRYSDISMHAGCTGFPACTSENEHGQLVHTVPEAPATVVKSKREGSSSTKRKSSNKREKSDRTEKKVRRSSRLLQHGPRPQHGTRDSSSEDDNGHLSDGDRKEVVESVG